MTTGARLRWIRDFITKHPAFSQVDVESEIEARMRLAGVNRDEAIRLMHEDYRTFEARMDYEPSHRS